MAAWPPACGGPPPPTRRSARAASQSGHRRRRRPRRRGVHSPHGPAGGAYLSGRLGGMAPGGGPDPRRADHGLVPLSPLSGGARQRHSPDEGGARHRGRLHLDAHRPRQVLPVLRLPREWHRARPRGALGARWRGHLVCDRPAARPEPRAGAVADSGRHVGGARRRVQHADRRGAFLPRGDHRGSPRTRPRLGRHQLRHLLDGAASCAGGRAAVPRRQLPSGAPRRTGGYAVLGVVGGLGSAVSSSCC